MFYRGNKNRRKKDCSNYRSEIICIDENLEDSNQRCFINDKDECVKKYINCPKFSKKEVCNSINLVPSNKICIYDEKEEICILHYKDCSVYKGNNKDICMNNYDSLDKDKKCFMENGKCVAKYIYCENYTDTNAEYCSSIIPHNAKRESVGSTYKCIMGENNRCVRKRKECKDLKTFEECQFFEISLTQNCAFINGKCIEQYKTCENYNNNGNEIKENECNSIILEDETSKCVFDQGKCEKKKKMCSDFNIENYITKCSGISEKFTYKKCIYSDSICKDVNRTCLEITSKTTYDICINAEVSDPDSRRCIPRKSNGCEEIDKVIYSDKVDEVDKGITGLGLLYKLSIYNLLFNLFVLIL